MTAKKELPRFVEIAPGKFIAMTKLTVGQLRRALVTEHLAGQDERFRDLLWLRRRVSADAKDTDLVIEHAGVKQC
jgi:hypothetical protein